MLVTELFQALTKKRKKKKDYSNDSELKASTVLT